MKGFLEWVEPQEQGWPPSYWGWRCKCGADVSVIWHSACGLYTSTDELIEATDADASSWKLECHDGHVLLLCHELDDEPGGDN